MFKLNGEQFVAELKKCAEEAGVPNPEELGSHAIRRGRARDLLDAGASLADVMLAGEWRSSAVLFYLRRHQLDEAAMAKLVLDNSDSE